MPNAGFQEIAEHMRSLIGTADGWQAGAALPSENRLAAQWGVTRTTIRRALGVLEAENLIEVSPGRGRFVRAGSGATPRRAKTRLETVAAAIRAEIASGVVVDRLDSEAGLAERFGVSQGTVREALKRLSAEGVVVAVHGKGWFVNEADRALTRTEEVVERIRTAIKSGVLAEGSSLPGEIPLAAEYGVGRITVRRALAELESEGWVIKVQGRGRVVAKAIRTSEGA